jgi:hypothetical protein
MTWDRLLRLKRESLKMRKDKDYLMGIQMKMKRKREHNL